MVNLFHTITALLPASTVAPMIDITDAIMNLPGKTVPVQTEAYGPQFGTVQYVCPSPFYGDDTIMVYVVSLPGEPGWATYIPMTEAL